MCVCFFKQKTAYEMRISDWSSDVCSSDLALRLRQSFISRSARCSAFPHRTRYHSAGPESLGRADGEQWRSTHGHSHLQPSASRPNHKPRNSPAKRSEEHTSELQSLMRISYAVFCLKKKHQKQLTQLTTNT